jgi:hypothetical protein
MAAKRGTGETLYFPYNQKENVMAKNFFDSIATLEIRGCGGDPQAATIFTGWLDSDWENYGLNKPSPVRPDTKVRVDKLVADANEREMFGTAPKGFFTPAQAAVFVRDRENKYLAPDNRATLIPVQVGDEFFVVVVSVPEGKPRAGVFEFDPNYAWSGSSGAYVVRPQL